MTNNPLDQFADVKRWVNWKLETKDGKPTKVPYQPGGALASTTDPATWSTLANLHRNGFSGPGIVFTPDRLLMGVDGDHILNGALNITDYRFRKFVAAADTYTEYSQSNTGLHVFLALTEPLDLDANKKKFKDGRGYECYTVGRYFTVTFKPFTDKPIRQVTPAEAIKLLELLGYPWPKHLADDKLLERMFAARNGSKAHALYDGDISDYGNDDSAADMAFCNMLAWWTNQDTAQMERIWLASKLGERDKVQDRKDYRDRTIQAALDEVKGGYDPNADRVIEDQLKQTTDTNAAPEDTPADPQADNLPSIQANNRELRNITTDAMQALATTKAAFVRGGELVRVKFDEKGHASIESMSESALRGMLARAANFFALRERRKDGESEFVEVPVAPPLDVVRDILSLGVWDFPPIEGVIESPTMRPDGTILCTSGYDPATRLFYQPAAGFVMPGVPAHPTKADAIAALAVLNEALTDFPFEKDENGSSPSHDNALGAIQTITARPMIRGPVPISICDSPQQATGKTLLTSTIGLLATGEPPDVSPAPTDPDEWRKVITSKLAEGRGIVIFDNLTHTLDDGSLAGATTASMWSDRRMGRNDSQIRVPVRTVFMVTGNNVRVGGDLVSRCYLIRLDAKMSRPQDRDDFKHPDIEQWVKDHRGQLIGAVLTIARAWVEAGRPKPTCPKMRQGEWREVVGGMLEFAGVKSFLNNQKRYYETADDDTPVWEAFITALAEYKWPAMPEYVTPGQIYQACCIDAGLADVLPDELRAHLGEETDKRAKGKFTQRLGYELKSRNGKRYGDSQARIEAEKRTGTGPSRWRFVVDLPTEERFVMGF